ncbi:hypothetical protein [Streptomyces sp. NPDC088246]|uniref:hypothetical protein n=1 Tax=Streptomyces sp. NPDC088246 TaxID=3365842 RepID=UPI003826DD0D
MDILADGVKSPAPLAAMRQAAGTDMNELLAKVLEAHSGIERWSELTVMQASALHRDAALSRLPDGEMISGRR